MREIQGLSAIFNFRGNNFEWNGESIFLSRVEGRESHVEDGGSRVIYFFLVFAVGSISAAQSSQVCMFLPDLVKCSLT